MAHRLASQPFGHDNPPLGFPAAFKKRKRAHAGQPPLEVEFRVPTDTGKPVVLDFAVAGIWLSLEERDQFTSFLGQNGGSITVLNTHLTDLAKQYK